MFIALQMNTFVVQQPGDQELVGGWRGLRRESDHAGHKLAQHSALSTHSRTLRGGWCTTALVDFNTHPPLLSGTPYLSGMIYPEIKLQHTHPFVAGKTTKPVTACYLFGHKAPWFIKTILIAAICYAGLLVFILSWNSPTADIHLREALYCCFYADSVIRHSAPHCQRYLHRNYV